MAQPVETATDYDLSVLVVSIGCIFRSGNAPTLNINAIWSESTKSYLKSMLIAVIEFNH